MHGLMKVLSARMTESSDYEHDTKSLQGREKYHCNMRYNPPESECLPPHRCRNDPAGA